jgi:GNAT superfamily N-acetyltransferase
MLIQRLTNSDPALLDRIGTIYADSIPTSERKPNSWLPRAAARSDYAILAGVVENDVVGFGILFVPSDEPMALLEYFAVDAAHRNRGIGSELISQILASLLGRCVLAEVESNCGLGNENARRQTFYRRIGFRKVVGLDYLLPLDFPVPPLDLWLLNSPNPLGRGVLARWLEIVYERVYGRSAGDARLATMVRQLSDPVELE